MPNMLVTLRTAKPADRPALLEQLHEKNLRFLQASHPQVFQFIKTGHCPYRIDITESFLNIIDERTGELAHPEGGLDNFAELLGSWTHNAWVELFNVQVPILNEYPQHAGIVRQFTGRLREAFPLLEERMRGGRINLKELTPQTRFSPPVVFLGIFHGLHIVHHLARTELGAALFIEPEPHRFEVSCYFLDYEAIEQRLGPLFLAIGDDMTALPISLFFHLLRVTPMVWARVLCGYPFDQAHLFIETLKGLQATNTNLLYPLDNELKALSHGAFNIKRKLPILSGRPKLSQQCRIAVVATGPSLNNDLDWLRDNQDRLIIFAVHSAVRVLRQHGVQPDFQFNLDAVISYDFVNALQLDPAIPLVSDYKAPPHILRQFATPLLCGETYKQSVARLGLTLTQTHPSTTNLALSFACFLRPRALYLIGCDCGYRSLDRDHAQGAIYDDQHGQSDSYAKNALQNLVAPNFPDTEPVQTISQHLQTKIILEKCIDDNAQGIPVFNLSDGAFIKGARPKHSEQIQLHPYRRKQKDVQRILQAFSPAKAHGNWTPYPIGGREKLQQLKQRLLDGLEMETFDWKQFSQALDAALFTVLQPGWREQDFRMDTYSRPLEDLLCIWYAAAIFFDTREDAEQVYLRGKAFLRDALDALVWPESFDRIAENADEDDAPPEDQFYLALQVHAPHGELARAEALIKRAYAQAPELRDGFVQLALPYAEQCRFAQALLLARRDLEANRLSPPRRVFVAHLLGRTGDLALAEALIQQAYEDDPSLKNGFAALGWQLMKHRDWIGADRFFARDRRMGRLGPGWTKNDALVQACLGNWDQAFSRLEQAYAASPKLRGGYGELGWWGYLAGRGASFFQEQIEHDQRLGRTCPRSTFFQALALIVRREAEQAQRLVETAQQSRPEHWNWHWSTSLAWLHVRLGEPNLALPLMERDDNQGRMHPAWLPSFALTLGWNGKMEQARAILQKLASLDGPACYNIGYLAFPEARMTLEQLSAFVNEGRPYTSLEMFRDFSGPVF